MSSSTERPAKSLRDPRFEELTDGEMALMEKLLGNPRLWPDSAKVWIADYVSQNLLLPVSQLQGFGQYIFTRGTQFPTNPSDGQVFLLTVDAASGTVWGFRYNQQSASSYKWEFVGGPPLQGIVTAAQTTTSSTYGNLATTGPTVTTPRGGDYLVTTSCRMSVSGADAVLMSYAIGASAASDNDAIAQVDSSGGNPLASSRITYKTGVAASTALTAKYRNQSNVNTATFSERYISIEPVRVS